MGDHHDDDGNHVADRADRELADAHRAARLARPVDEPWQLDDATPARRLLAAAPPGQPVAWGIDAAADISVATLNAQGASFICCYLAPDSQRWKVRTPQRIHEYLAAGKRIVFNWESDGTPGSGWQSGVDAARKSAELLAARRAHCATCARLIGDAPVIFTFADSGSPPLDRVLAATLGAASVLGHDRTGGYGGIATIDYLADRDACRYLWQTYAWSGGRRDPRAQLYQRKNTASMDFDVAYAEDYAQVPRPAGASQEDNMTPDQDRMLREVHDQLLGRWPGWRWNLPVGQAQPAMTLVDYVRGLDQIIATRFTLDGRPLDPAADDTSTGHLLSLREEVRSLGARLDRLIESAPTKGV